MIRQKKERTGGGVRSFFAADTRQENAKSTTKMQRTVV